MLGCKVGYAVCCMADCMADCMVGCALSSQLIKSRKSGNPRNLKDIRNASNTKRCVLPEVAASLGVRGSLF